MIVTIAFKKLQLHRDSIVQNNLHIYAFHFLTYEKRRISFWIFKCNRYIKSQISRINMLETSYAWWNAICVIVIFYLMTCIRDTQCSILRSQGLTEIVENLCSQINTVLIHISITIYTFTMPNCNKQIRIDVILHNSIFKR